MYYVFFVVNKMQFLTTFRTFDLNFVFIEKRSLHISRKALHEKVKMTQWKFHNALLLDTDHFMLIIFDNYDIAQMEKGGIHQNDFRSK